MVILGHSIEILFLESHSQNSCGDSLTQVVVKKQTCLACEFSQDEEHCYTF